MQPIGLGDKSALRQDHRRSGLGPRQSTRGQWRSTGLLWSEV